jgi:hypothetical protein
MFRERAFLVSYFHRAGLVILLLAFFILTLTCCRKKDYPKPSPTGPITGNWTLVLLGPMLMYRDSVSGHVPNDTIIVRLYDPDGNLHGGASVFSQALASPGDVSASVTSSSDTVNHPYGTVNPLYYWGDGGTEGHETVTSWAVNDGDTVASTALSFKVMDAH